ncbi:iron chelate uptake ABC transporter family permease subunit [Cobetia sp. L2A1]|uniref:iron chelate uptake ABC transporter family permease subunit n=1 Tax=Cobetia sp. L2A1 TaxID=2686360 RepID=UPI00131D0FF0|nr:iron chelate uptake ABC transporter family permease subunit [Cobetia sp. L2A1]
MTSAVKLGLVSVMLAAVFVMALMLGEHTVNLASVMHLLIQHDAQDFVVWNHRFPRSMIALVTGAAMGVSGALVQGIIRNPLASPDILGVTQGAGLALSIALLIFPSTSPALLPLVAGIGGFCGAALLMAYNIDEFSPVRFALTGIAISVTFSGITEFLLLTHPTEVNTALLSLTGSLWARGWQQLWPVISLLPMLCASMLLAKPLDLMALGDQSAASLGVRMKCLRWGALGLAVLMVSVSVSIVGPITFVGLVSPHIARRIMGGRHLQLLPVAAMVGAVILLASDMLGRSLMPPSEIPAGVLTAIVGAPYFLWLLHKAK